MSYSIIVIVWFFTEFQIFQDHDVLSERFRKTLYYGQMPINGNRFSMSMTKFCVDQVQLVF